jgi:hypothetical protein
LVIEIDNLRFIERDATVGCHDMALMDNFPLARHPVTRVPAGEPDMAGLKPMAVRLLPHEHGRQIPEFRFHFCGIGYGIRDFLAKEFAIPLAKPVNGHLERSL